jgi:hypothetical protein
MKIWRLVSVTLSFAFCVVSSGCVVGGGACLWLAPVRHTFTGTVHFRDFPATNGIDNVPVLTLDDTAYIYAPNHRHQCLAANDLQLIGVSEFPDNVGEKSHVKVKGSIAEEATASQYTRYSINVLSIQPIKPAP